MRECYELAWSCAKLYSHQDLLVERIEDIEFL